MKKPFEPGMESAPPAVSRRAFFGLLAGAAAVLLLLAWAIFVLHPLPPRHLTLACGPEGSSYASYAKRYQKLLARQGIALKLTNTTGGLEDLKLLKDPKSGVDLGFADSGLAPVSETETAATDLVSLGTVSYEPIWFFTRRAATDRVLFDLNGRKISLGPWGSDSRYLMYEIFKRNRLKLSDYHFLDLSPSASASALLAGQIDAAVLVNSFASPVVRQLIQAPGIQVADFERADAYVALFPSLTKLTLPEGALSLKDNRPAKDLTLLATKTSLLARKDMNPALQYLVLEMLSQVHSRSGIFQKAGTFPASEELDFPLSQNAKSYYRSGRPFLERYLPFWLAVLLEQAALVLIPVLGLAYPLVRGLISLYGWSMRRKIFQIYAELHSLERQVDKLGRQAASAPLLQRFDQLQEKVSRVRVSSTYIPMLYSLKENLVFVRSRLEKAGKGRAG